MNSKIKKVLIASALTFGLIGATFISAPTTASACGIPSPFIQICDH